MAQSAGHAVDGVELTQKQTKYVMTTLNLAHEWDAKGTLNANAKSSVIPPEYVPVVRDAVQARYDQLTEREGSLSIRSALYGILRKLPDPEER